MSHYTSTRRSSLERIGLILIAVLLFNFIALPLLRTVRANNEPTRLRGELTSSERVQLQSAIDEVYWDHSLWPEANGSKPLFAATEAARLSANKVDDVLRKTNALAQLWQQSITGEMLQAELNRMAANSKRPGMLRELFGTVQNDAYLAAEVIARPALVDRLARRFFASDSRFKTRGGFDEWWKQNRDRFDTKVTATRTSYYLPAVVQAESEVGTWRPMSALPVSTGTVIWTGTEMIVWGGGTDSGSRYNPATDTWQPTSTIGAPSTRRFHTAVWTGSEMIIWGGCNTSTDFCGEKTGGRYNPLTDTWISTSIVNAALERKEHSAVWTGSEMIIWGGCKPSSNNFCNTIGNGSPGAYNPSNDTWRVVPEGGIEGRTKHTAIWTGTEMIIWGGIRLGVLNNGGRYNPSTNTWVATSTVNAPLPRQNHTAIWTGSEMIVWGGREPSSTSSFNTGGKYNPTSDAWTPTSVTNAPAPRIDHTAVWTGTEMIVWGGDLRQSHGLTNSGGRYRPDTDTWTATNLTNAPSARTGHVAVWTGSLMIVWSDVADKSGGRYNPITDSWTPTNNADSAPVVYNGVWTGTEMIVWGGHPSFLAGGPPVGGRYNPTTDEWRAINLTGSPLAPNRDRTIVIVWSGTEVLVWGMGSNTTGSPGQGGRYNPTSDSWTLMTTAGAPIARSFHAGVWSGSQLIVWGGQDFQGTFRNDGGRYNPATNSWQSIDISSAPAARYLHSAVWSGSEMIIWGGAINGLHFNTGGRYNPGTNSWQPTSTTNAPLARRYHSSIWTGSEMIIWGGRDGDFNNNNLIYETGGKYNPTTDSWQATNVVDAPIARFLHSGVWTGSRMIVWGGMSKTDSNRKEYSTGGIYDPSDDSWVSTSLLRASSGRSKHVGLWTGTEMLIWGGDKSPYTGAASHGALFTPPAVTPTPTPTPVPSPTSTPTPVASPTPFPTPFEPTPTPTPVPSPTAFPTPFEPTPTPTPIPSPTPTPQSIEFEATAYTSEESQRVVALTVKRSGDISAQASVSYTTDDKAGWDDCKITKGTASSRCDYSRTFGTVRFGAGESSKTISIPIINDAFAEGPEDFVVRLSNALGGTVGANSETVVTIDDQGNSTTVNPVDEATFFVRQHYLDFLSREPDSAGLNFWVNEINSCGSDAQCREVRRVNVSAAFFLSIEFQKTGYFAYLVHKSAFGDVTSPNVIAAVPRIRLQDFLMDSQFLGHDVRVGIGNWEQQLATNRQAYVQAFVTRADFGSQYPAALTATQFVDKLNQNAGRVLSPSERDQLISELTSASDQNAGRSSVLLQISDNALLGQRESSRAFVLMEYFGYLRRNPDDPQNVDFTGWEFWLNKLNQFNGNFVDADMVKSFIVSGEYRNRFGN